MLEEKIDELTIALNANTEVLQKLHDLKVGDVPTKKSIGELEQEMYAKQEAEGAATTETATKKSKKKTSKKKTAKKSEAVEPATATTSQTAETSTQAPLDKEKVQTHIRGIASQLKDTGKLFALIQKHGAQQFSDLDPSVYEALIADAEQLVADGE